MSYLRMSNRIYRSAALSIITQNIPHLLQVFLIFLLLGLSACQSRNLLVIVDMEPDDRIALMLLAAEFPTEIVSAGTTGMHAGRKQILAEQFLEQSGLVGIPVIQGTGGEAASYPEIASSKAAREYQSEGKGLLPEADLILINRDKPRSSEELSVAIRKSLRERGDIEIVLLAPATDLVHALELEPSLKTRIKHIHMMAGWSEKKLATGEMQKRTTYNWNMDPVAGATLMSMQTIPMTVYSSHMIKGSFAGGSINSDNFPSIIGELESQRCRVPAFNSFLTASSSWDHHLMQKIPPLRAIIGDNAGRQFTPADPIVVVGMARTDFITSERAVKITIDLNDLDPAKGFGVKVEADPESQIMLVEGVDTEIFRQQVLRDLRKLAVATSRPPTQGTLSVCPQPAATD